MYDLFLAEPWLFEDDIAQSCTININSLLEKVIRPWANVDDGLMDFLKAFDSVLHDLLIAKMYACGFSLNSLIFFVFLIFRDKKKT